MKSRGALNPADLNTPLSSEDEVVRQFLWGAPKLRQLLIELESVLYGKNRNPDKPAAAVFCHSPKTAEVVYKLLGYLGIPTEFLDSTMSAEDRERRIRAFNEGAGTTPPLVLLSTFSLNIAGYDRHRRAATAIFVECTSNWETEL